MPKEDESAGTWQEALNAYKYRADLSEYQKRSEFPGFFGKRIPGCRKSTIEFEDYFRGLAPKTIQVWYEVAFWKLYSQPPWRSRKVSSIVDYTSTQAVTAAQLWEATQQFIRTPSKIGLTYLRGLLGFKYGMAVPLTFVAFADPQSYPMVDRRVADWVNANLEKHNAGRNNKLTKFRSREWKKANFIPDSDFGAYMDWVSWCREIASMLSGLTNTCWRARDVEMAIFTAYRPVPSLSVLP